MNPVIRNAATTLIAVAITFSLVGCGGDDDDRDSKRDGQKDAPKNQPSDSSAAKATAAPPIKLQISKATTFVDGPLRADGSIDYVAAFDRISREGVTKKNNAGLAIFRIIGPEFVDEKWQPHFYKGLDIEPLPDDGDYFLSLEDYIRSVATEEELKPDADGWPSIVAQMDELESSLGEQIWKAEDHPHVAAWLKKNESAMKRIAQASTLTHWYMPNGLSEEKAAKPGAAIYLRIPNLGITRQISRAFCIRSTLRIGQRDLQGAWKDLMVVYRLGRLVAQPKMAIYRLVGISIDAMAFQTMLLFVSDEKITTDQARQFAKAYNDLPSTLRVGESINIGERIMNLDMVFAFHELAGDFKALKKYFLIKASLSPLQKKRLKEDFDINQALKLVNTRFDQMVALDQLPTTKAIEVAAEKIDHEFSETAKRAERTFQQESFWEKQSTLPILQRRTAVTDAYMAWIFPKFVSSLSFTYLTERQIDMTSELFHLAFSLATYRAERKQFPNQLADLIPKYAPSIPTDLFSEKPVIYRKTEKGYVLYSVGRNGIDDGGVEVNGDNPLADIIIEVD